MTIRIAYPDIHSKAIAWGTEFGPEGMATITIPYPPLSRPRMVRDCLAFQPELKERAGGTYRVCVCPSVELQLHGKENSSTVESAVEV